MTRFKIVSALLGVTLNDCYATEVYSEMGAVSWYNRSPTIASKIAALSVVLEGISAQDLSSQAGDITAKQGYFDNIRAAGSLDLDKVQVNEALSHNSAAVSNSTINTLQAVDYVRLDATRIRVLKLYVEENRGVVELCDRSNIQKIVIATLQRQASQDIEITLSGNGFVNQPLFFENCFGTVVNYL